MYLYYIYICIIYIYTYICICIIYKYIYIYYIIYFRPRHSAHALVQLRGAIRNFAGPPLTPMALQKHGGKTGHGTRKK